MFLLFGREISMNIFIDRVLFEGGYNRYDLYIGQGATAHQAKNAKTATFHAQLKNRNNRVLNIRGHLTGLWNLHGSISAPHWEEDPQPQLLILGQLLLLLCSISCCSLFRRASQSFCNVGIQFFGKENRCENLHVVSNHRSLSGSCNWYLYF